MLLLHVSLRMRVSDQFVRVMVTRGAHRKSKRGAHAPQRHQKILRSILNAFWSSRESRYEEILNKDRGRKLKRCGLASY